MRHLHLFWNKVLKSGHVALRAPCHDSLLCSQRVTCNVDKLPQQRPSWILCIISVGGKCLVDNDLEVEEGAWIGFMSHVVQRQ